jgi:tripeptidyl-peptidase-1
MKVLAVLFAFAAMLASVTAAPLFTRNTVPAGWTKSVVAKPNAKVHFHVALTQQNLDKLDTIFNEVSNPEHDNYLNFMTSEDIQALVAPKPEARKAVMSWWEENGVEKVLDFVDSVEAWTTVERAQKMFGTKFYEFSHKETGKRVVKSFGTVSVPDEVHDVIDSVMGLSTFPVPHYSAHKRPMVADDPENDAILPQTIWSLYSLPTNISSGTSSIGQGVIEWEDQYFAPKDLVDYGTSVNIKIPAVPTNQIIGTNDPKQPGDESTLDIQFIGGVNPSASNWFWIEGDSVWLYGFATHFVNTTTVPDLISISYGWWEGDQCEEGIGAEECQKLGVDTVGYVQRVNTEFQKIGVRGVSVFVSSGDSGAHTRSDGECQMPATLADFPGSSPYITSVGATQVNSETFFDPSIAPICSNKDANYTCVKSGVEVAVNVTRSFFTSGGGFSNISQRMSFQEAAVQAYLMSGVPLPPASYFNHTGRAYPDVSAVGHNGYILEGGVPSLIGGTSQSSPTFAAVASLLADAFKAKTGKSFGFISPLLYAAWASDATTFIDITVGDNICTEDGCSPTCTGYVCTKGWDPVTGLGSPNYAQLLKYVNTVADKYVARHAAKNTNMYASKI